ncbi:DUF3558 domain-containing protein [Streptomyces sp. NPDC008313]|uniref:DUF3558 domain-containing protein n=1 Tax=Streptomyces sp. NPDC008313 TaxID=3364826 RepID=UPI0036E0AF50
MQRKAYVPGVALLLSALLAACTGGSGDEEAAGDSKSGRQGTTQSAAQPGRYRTLPEACGAVGQSTLDTLLPGIERITDESQREKAYAGEATVTYDTDRRVGCRWKVDSGSATDHLLLDFERVVSYDNAVSDDDKAQDVYASKEEAAGLPAPTDSGTESDSAADEGSSDAGDDGADAHPDAAGTSGDGASADASTPPTPADLRSRTLDGLGSEAFLDDELSEAASTTGQRTVTVVFRTSNVVVTVEYAEQPTASGETPDSEEMQDRARKLAQQLADSLDR